MRKSDDIERREVMGEMMGALLSGTDECLLVATTLKKITVIIDDVPLDWAACRLGAGAQPKGSKPYRTCGLVGCLNPNHFEWRK